MGPFVVSSPHHEQTWWHPGGAGYLDPHPLRHRERRAVGVVKVA